MRAEQTEVERWQDGPEAAVAKTAALPSALPPEQPQAVQRFKFLTAEGQSATPLEQEALLGANDLLEASFLERCALVSRAIGRLKFVTPRGRSCATGFLIAPGYILTNHHVFPTAVSARGATIEFDYRYDVAGQLPVATEEYDLAPDVAWFGDEALDFAVFAVAPRSTTGRAAIADRGYLRLIPQTGKAEFGEFVTIIQHPDGEPLRIALRENQITRLEDDEPFIWYRADTAHGSSGAPVFNDSLQLVALHSSGRIKRDEAGRYALASGGFAATLDGLSEKDVVWEANVGMRVSRICASLLAQIEATRPDLLGAFQAAMQGGDVLSRAVERAKSSGMTNERKELAMTEHAVLPGASAALPPHAGTEGLVIPLQLRVSLEAAGALRATATPATAAFDAAAASSLQLERLEYRIPIIYDGLETRAGFEADFLALDGGRAAPAPALTDAGRAVAAPLLDGSGHELKYSHFSVWMHRERRLALMTAANVDWRARKRLVDGKKTDRDTLAGWPGENFIAERWVNDPRIDPRHQLHDIFYTEDRKAFDKGHLVRRDDVCWGSTYEDIQRANGDTYHVTNCSPQIAAFNKANEGEQNWGDLEEHVAKVTKRDVELAIIYAGPVFDASDRWFTGVDDFGPVRVQIPRRFWKIVVVKGQDGAEAYGFLLEQDVRAITEEEFAVTPEWIGSLKPIAEIEGLLRGWISLAALVACDQYARVHAER